MAILGSCLLNNWRGVLALFRVHIARLLLWFDGLNRALDLVSFPLAKNLVTALLLVSCLCTDIAHAIPTETSGDVHYFSDNNYPSIKLETPQAVCDDNAARLSKSSPSRDYECDHFTYAESEIYNLVTKESDGSQYVALQDHMVVQCVDNTNGTTVDEVYICPEQCQGDDAWNYSTKQCEAAPRNEKSLGECDGESCCLGNPISAGTGNKYQTETDIRLISLTFSRTYNSTELELNGAPVSTVMGAHWNHSFERYVVVDALDANKAYITRPDGKSHMFVFSGGQWLADADVFDQLAQLTDSQGTPTGWRYTTTENAAEDYDTAGKLVSIMDVRGNVQTLSYDGNSRLDRVDTTTGESLQFGYDTSNRTSTVIDHAGRVWGYRYDTNNNLEYVDNPDITTKQYHYEDARFPNALTGITDERAMPGEHYASFGYDSYGRAILSTHAGDAQKVTIAYNDATGVRTVRNSLNQPSTYSTAVQLGVALVTGVSGPGCSTCGTGDSGFAYDAANNLIGRNDNAGVTRFGNYDSRGQFGCKVEGLSPDDTTPNLDDCAYNAITSPNARRTDYTYDSRFYEKIASITVPSVFAVDPATQCTP